MPGRERQGLHLAAAGDAEAAQVLEREVRDEDRRRELRGTAAARPAPATAGGTATSSKLTIPAASGAGADRPERGGVIAPGRRQPLDPHDDPVQRRLGSVAGAAARSAVRAAAGRRERVECRSPAPSRPRKSGHLRRACRRGRPAAASNNKPLRMDPPPIMPFRIVARAGLGKGKTPAAARPLDPRRPSAYIVGQARTRTDGHRTLRGDRRRLRLPRRLGGPVSLRHRARPDDAAARRGAARAGDQGRGLRQPGLDRAADRPARARRRGSTSRAIRTR